MGIQDILLSTLPAPQMQGMTGTNAFFEWYFYGLNGLGGWLFFLLLGAAAVVWLFYDSQNRHLPATGWRLGVVLLALLVLPTIIYRFTVTPVHFGIYQLLELYPEDCPTDVITQNFPEVNFLDCEQLRRSLPPLTPFGEYVFYLGLLGGILAPVLAVGYYITYQGMVGCPRGHPPYEKALEKIPGQCPQCAAEDARRQPQVIVQPPVVVSTPQREPAPPPPPPGHGKPAVSYAWLVDEAHNRRYDLYEGVTRIGRGNENEIMLTDPAVSRNHAQIREAHGHFTLSDMSSRTGTLLNGKKLSQPFVLQSGDEIVLGDSVLRFVSSR